MTRRFMSGALALNLALINAAYASAQQDTETTDPRTPVVFTTRQDHQNMLDQLGITEAASGPKRQCKFAERRQL